MEDIAEMESGREPIYSFADGLDGESECANGESSKQRSESPVVTFNTAANIEQKLEIITHRFNGFTKELITERTKRAESNHSKVQNVLKAVLQLQKLVDVLSTAREHQLRTCTTKIGKELDIWPKEHNKEFNPQLDEQSEALQELNERIASISHDFQQNHLQMTQYLDSKMRAINDKFAYLIDRYNEQKQKEYDDHQQTLSQLRQFDRECFESFEQQIKQREKDVISVKERVAVMKPQRSITDKDTRVFIEQGLVKSYKALESEEAKRTETIDELFRQIQHYTSRLKSCIV